MKRLLLALLVALYPAVGYGQTSILQGGNYTAGHVPIYSSPTFAQPIVTDGGGAAGGGPGVGLSELNVTSRGSGSGPFASNGTGPFNSHFCLFDNAATTANYHYFCIDPNSAGGGLMSYGAAGTATALPLSFNVNGSTYQFPFTTSGAVGPGTTVVGDIACWNNTVGTLLSDCAAFGTTGATVPLNNGNNTFSGNSTFSGNNTYSGTGAFTGLTTFAGSVRTTPTGTFGLAGSGSGITTIIPQAAASGTLSVPAATDTLIGRATTDTLTNKTYDTAGTGNAFKVNGQTITAVTGANATVLTGGTQITNSLGSNTVLNNTSNYFDGPSIAQGSTGTWFASGTVSVLDTAGAANILCKLWDGTTVIAASYTNTTASNAPSPVALSGYLAAPAGNIRISCKDATSTSGIIGANGTSNGNKDSTISAFRIN